MKKVLNEKMMSIVFVCLGLVNLLSFLFVPFFGQFYWIDRTYPSPFYLMFFYDFMSPYVLFPQIVFLVNMLLSLFLIILGLIKLLSKKAQQRKTPISSNKNPFFIISMVLLIVNILAIPMFYVNAYLNNEANCSGAITEWGFFGNGYGTYTIFPLNALISLAYILWVTLKPVEK